MWVKICGITRIQDAQDVVSAGASAIGLNFFSGSRRFVSGEQAVRIAEAARMHDAVELPVDVVGVFVNSSVDEVVATARAVSLTAVQFHGDESVETIAEFHRRMPTTRIIRAFRVSMNRCDECLQAVDVLQQQVPLAACLLDAFVQGEFGGTGKTMDLGIPKRYLEKDRPRLILAGGLTANNVDDVLRKASPWGVDTASGVESAPGLKDSAMCRAFVVAAMGRSVSASVRL